jgi:hypothetical protein
MKIVLDKIKTIMTLNRNKKESVSFFDLSSKEKAKIIRTATRKANEDQKRLVEEFDRKYCHTKA